MSKEKEIAIEIYDLDERVYKSLASTLGRVFTNEKEICIKQITHNIKHRKSHIIRSDLALIFNMINTIEDEELQQELLEAFTQTKQALEQLPKEFNSADILDTELNEMREMKQGENQNLIICIGRQFGSAGTEIGFELASRLNIGFYDREIFEMVSERLEIGEDELNDYLSGNVTHKKDSFLQNFNKYHGLAREDAFFFNQSDLIRKMAKEQSFVIVGRCADAILAQSQIPHYSIFIEAPSKLRIKRTMEMKNMDFKEAVRFVKQMDRYHKKYYNFYTRKKWGHATNYDLCINSATYGIEGTVDIIERMIIK